MRGADRRRRRSTDPAGFRRGDRPHGGTASLRARPRRGYRRAARAGGGGRDARRRLGLRRGRSVRRGRPFRDRPGREALPSAVPAHFLRTRRSLRSERRGGDRHPARTEHWNRRRRRRRRAARGADRAGPAGLRPAGRGPGQGGEQRLRGAHATAGRLRTAGDADARGHGERHGDPERPSDDDGRRAARGPAALDTRGAHRKGGDHVQRTAAVPRTRRGDQPRHAPRRRRDSHGRSARRLLEPLLWQLGGGRQPRLRGARMVGRHHLFGGTDPVETAHRPAFEAYARRRNVRHRAASGPRQRDDRTPAARLGGVRPGEQGACQRGLHGIVHATQCGRFAGGGQLRPLVEPPRRRRSDAQPRSALHDRVGNGPRARLHALPDGRPGRHAQRIRRRHEAGFRRRVGTADRPPQLQPRPTARSGQGLGGDLRRTARLDFGP